MTNLKTLNGLIFCHLCDQGRKELNAVLVDSNSLCICNDCLAEINFKNISGENNET